MVGWVIGYFWVVHHQLLASYSMVCFLPSGETHLLFPPLTGTVSLHILLDKYCFLLEVVEVASFLGRGTWIDPNTCSTGLVFTCNWIDTKHCMIARHLVLSLQHRVTHGSCYLVLLLWTREHKHSYCYCNLNMTHLNHVRNIAGIIADNIIWCSPIWRRPMLDICWLYFLVFIVQTDQSQQDFLGTR